MTQTTPSHSQAVEAAKCFAADGVTPTYTAPGLPIMVSAVAFNELYSRLTSQQEVAAPVGGREITSIDDMCAILKRRYINASEYTDCAILYQVTFDQLRAIYDEGRAASRVPVASLAEPANYDKQEIDLLVHRITGQDTAEDSIDALQNAVRILDGKTIAAVVDELYDAAQATTGSGQGVTDARRLDHLQMMAENGFVSMCFEMDGGFHVTLEGVADQPEAARNVESIRAGIDWHLAKMDAAILSTASPAGGTDGREG